MVKILAVVALAFMALAGASAQMYNDEVEYMILDASEYEIMGLGGYGGGHGGYGGYGAGGYGGQVGLQQQIVGLPTVIQGGNFGKGPLGMMGPGGKKGGGGGAMNILIGVPTPVQVARPAKQVQEKVRTVYVDRPVYIHQQEAAVDTKGMNYHYEQPEAHEETAQPIYEDAGTESTKGMQYQQVQQNNKGQQGMKMY